MSVNFPGEQPESVSLKSTSECECGCTECVCVTRCADSINENVHTQDTCDNGDEISGDGGGKECDTEAACTELSECEHERESSVYKNGEEIAEDAENGTRSAQESDKGSVSTKEQVVLVEKEGCATVVMYPERHTAHLFLADGTVITGDNQGAYQVGGLQQITSKFQVIIYTIDIFVYICVYKYTFVYLPTCVCVFVCVCLCIQGVPIQRGAPGDPN